MKNNVLSILIASTLFALAFECCAGMLSGWYGVEAMFGERLDYYDKSLWDETPLPKGRDEIPGVHWKDGMPGWRCYRYGCATANCIRGSHRECIVEFEPHKKSDFFDEYKAHLLPVSHRIFHITAQKSFGSKAECRGHFNKVKELLILKYGQPILDKGSSVSFKDGKKEIGLICTNLSGKLMVYIDVFIRALIEKDLIDEYRKSQASKLDAL